MNNVLKINIYHRKKKSHFLELKKKIFNNEINGGAWTWDFGVTHPIN